MRLMEGVATLGGILTHDAMDHVMEHLSLTDCLHLRAVSKEVGTPLGLGLRLDAELASFEREFLRREDERQRLFHDFKTNPPYPISMILVTEGLLASEEVTLAHCEWKAALIAFGEFRKIISRVCEYTMLPLPPPVIYLGA